MKKGLLALLVTLSLGIVTNVDAMSKEQLKTKLTSSYNINGATFRLNSSQITQVERYLNSFDVSEEDADYIAGKVDEAVALVESGNATSISNLTSSERNKLTRLVNDISSSTSVKATVSGGDLVVYNPITGGVFTRINTPAKQTGTVNYVHVISGLVALIGVYTLVIKKGNNENA